VRNVGTYVLGADTALRDQINAGKSLGPRMQASGPYLTIPHGGGDLYIPDFKEPADNERFHAGVARDPEGFRERAEFLVDNGSDLLKVIASGAVLAFGGVPGEPEMTREDIAAVVDIAHAVGKKVAAHAHGAESIRMAIAAGVDTIEHASYLDDAGIAAARTGPRSFCARTSRPRRSSARHSPRRWRRAFPSCSPPTPACFRTDSMRVSSPSWWRAE
jgi:imidazolonepropionase-like amidohydrolase